MKIELIYETTCPNAPKAKQILLDVMANLGIKKERLLEVNKEATGVADDARNFASPSILVNGEDIWSQPGEGNACRIYRTADGKMSGIPPRGAIQVALEKAAKKGNWGVFGVIPLIGGAFLPVVTCGACWPLYTSILASVGLGFVSYGPYLGTGLMILGGIALVGLGFFGYRTKKWLVAGVGVSAVAAILLGKTIVDSDLLVYTGMFLSIAAIFLARRQRKFVRESCETC